jgi:predicted ATP-dependent endonuclease of OLD family
MLKKLRFKNYRSFKAWQEIEIKPITILVGPNSAGKSSILKLLGLFAQTSIHQGYEYLRLNGPLAKLGSFKSLANNYSDDPAIVELFSSLVSDKDEKLNTGLTYRWEIGSKWTNLSLSESKKEPYRFEIENYLGTYEREVFGGRQFRLDRRRGKDFRDAIDAVLSELKPIVKWLELNSSKENPIAEIRTQLIEDLRHPAWKNFDGNGLFPTERNELNELEYMPHSWSLIKKDKYLSSKNKRFTKLIKNETSSGRTKSIDELSRWKAAINQLDFEDPNQMEWYSHFGYYLMSRWVIKNHAMKFEHIHLELEELLPKFSSYFRSIMSDVHRLGPVRELRKNSYSREELQSLLGLEVEYNIGIQKYVDVSLELLGFPFKMQIQEVEKPSGQFLIEFQPKNSDILVPLSDMGFGFTQVLPVIFSALRRGITLIEQPELHLHPLSQARLAELFTTSYLVNSINDDGSMGRSTMNPQWSMDWSIFGGKATEIELTPNNRINGTNIIETHSEHFLRGLQLRIAQGVINPEDVHIYYVSKNRLGNSTVKRMGIRSDGFFADEWPDGFFDSASNLQEALWEAQK